MLLQHLQLGVLETTVVTLWLVYVHEASVVKKFLSCVRKFQTSLCYTVIAPWGLSYFVDWTSIQWHSNAIRFTSTMPQNSHNSSTLDTLHYSLSYFIKRVSSQEGGEHDISFNKLISQIVTVWETLNVRKKLNSGSVDTSKKGSDARLELIPGRYEDVQAQFLEIGMWLDRKCVYLLWI